MSYLRDRVVILKNEPYREHDSWITMYGRSHGKLVAVARGARRFGAKHLGHLEPFSQAEVMIAKGAAFDKLAVAQALPDRLDRSRLAALAVAGSFCDLMERLTQPGVADDQLSDLLDELFAALGRLPEDPSVPRARLVYAAAALKLLDGLGYGPVLEDKILLFLRRQPLLDVLRLTGSVDVFERACQSIEAACSAAPLDRAPHANRTITAVLGVF